LKGEIECIIDLLVPTELIAFDLGVLSISVDSRWEYSRLNCGLTG
jgi:hypothetical protein